MEYWNIGISLRGCLHEKKHPVYRPVNRLHRIVRIILLFVDMIMSEMNMPRDIILVFER